MFDFIQNLSNGNILTIENFINGEFVPCDQHVDSYNPSTGKVWATIPDSSEVDVNAAVAAANEAFQSWSQTTPRYRSQILRKIADLIEMYLDEFACIESKDQGKPVSLSKSVDIPRCILNFRFFASVILHETNESTMQEEPVKALNYVQRQPIGVAGLISPWNLPLYLLSFKVAPAIAVGNTVVAKPSEMTSVTAWMLAKVFREAGNDKKRFNFMHITMIAFNFLCLPAGVVNFVFGTGPKTGEALVKHPDVPLISFTGSTVVGQRIIEVSAPHYKKLSLEMGGKNPCIIFDDTDLTKCIPTVVRSSFANQGEICLCSSRIFVQNTIYEQFLEEFVRQTKSLTVGPATDLSVDLGSLISKEHWKKVDGYVKFAETDGATIVCGKEPLDLPEDYTNGYYMRPTIITNVTDNSKLMQEEIFGPVVCVVPFADEEEVVKRANNVKYGLSASVWSNNATKVHRVAGKLQAGTVWCNCWLVRDLNMPFGGTKASGIGREGAKDSLDFFTERKTICLKLD